MEDQNRPSVSMDGLITPAKPNQVSTLTHQPTTMQVIPRHRSAKGFLGLGKSPVGQAVYLIVVILLIGGAYSILNGGKSTSTSIPDESVPQTADTSIDFAAPTNFELIVETSVVLHSGNILRYSFHHRPQQ